MLTFRTKLLLCFLIMMGISAGLCLAFYQYQQEHLGAGLYLAISLGVLACIALSSYLAKSLTRPLRGLSEDIQAFVKSDFSAEFEPRQREVQDDEVGQIARDFAILRERMHEHVASIHKMAFFDILTGLASRGNLNRRLQEMISSAKRRKVGFTLFYLDLDAFKDVNDSLGHEAGDELLKEIARRLLASARENDLVARLGGDEFCILLEDLTDEADIARLAERCINNIGQPITLVGKRFKPRASIGVARYPMDGNDARSIMQAGDNAMYAAKVAGHHRFEFFDAEMSKQAADRLTLAQELRAAIRENQFVLHYQPQVDLPTGRIWSWEALVRWQHPKRGLVPPGEFVPEIERLGLIKDLGNWVLRAACQQVASWREQGLPDTRVSVNIAPRHLADASLLATVRRELSEAGLAPEQLEIEVTESGIQSGADSAALLEGLRKTGVRVAIDDFGTGYSSLGSLKDLPIDCLKIDRSFITNLLDNPQDAVLLGTIMALGQAMRFRVVAEGVEELEQIHVLQGLGCDLVQGFFFSAPIAPAKVPALAAEACFSSRIAEDTAARAMS
ncbi:MAG: EAL domain-containing protein [Pseudomonadota bacterium]